MKELVLDLSRWDKGVDISAWKSKRGLWGVIIKVGGNENGRYKDSVFETHYRNAKAAGLHIGFYYYTTVTNIDEAAKDARHMAELVGDKDYDLPWYMDVEDSRQFALSARTLTDVIKSFCNTLNGLGKYAGLYTGGSAWLNNVYADELRDYANWIAWWRSSWPSEAGDIGMWQQGCMRLSDGHIMFNDTSGYCDCDWCVVDYPSRIKSGQTKSSEEIQNGSTAKTKTPEATQTKGRASDVIGAAYGELGYYAPNDPERGSKYGRWMAEVTDEDWLAGPSTEIWWCCMFASWCLDQGGVVVKGFPSQNTDLALNGGARAYAVDKYSVRYGDIVIFNWDWDDATDHIGFATGSYDGTGFPTIEGNVGNAVVEKYRQLGNVAYILRPHYADSSSGDQEPSIDTNPKNNRDGGKLDVDGIGGWNTIIDWQHQLGTNEDGWITGQVSSNKKYHRGMSNVTYENGGSDLVSAIQRKVGATVDGHWGSGTSRAIQQWLVDTGYAIGSDGVDGYFGIESVKGLQQSLNDSKWS